jgi:hypothetical protein
VPQDQVVAVPDRISDRHLHRGVERDQEVQEPPVRSIDLGLGEPFEAEGRAHRVEGRPVRAIHRHPERHRGAEGREEGIFARSLPPDLPQEVEPEGVARTDRLELGPRELAGEPVDRLGGVRIGRGSRAEERLAAGQHEGKGEESDEGAGQLSGTHRGSFRDLGSGRAAFRKITNGGGGM